MTMPRHPFHRRVWTAILLLLLQALLPTAVYAASARGGVVELCTAYGIKKVALHDVPAHEAKPSQQHCPLCALSHAPALPPASATIPLPALLARGVAFLPDRHPHSVFRLCPQGRGPPASIS